MFCVIRTGEGRLKRCWYCSYAHNPDSFKIATTSSGGRFINTSVDFGALRQYVDPKLMSSSFLAAFVYCSLVIDLKERGPFLLTVVGDATGPAVSNIASMILLMSAWRCLPKTFLLWKTSKQKPWIV